MIKHLMASTAIVALLASGAAVAQQKSDDSSTQQPAAQQMQDKDINKSMSDDAKIGKAGQGSMQDSAKDSSMDSKKSQDSAQDSSSDSDKSMSTASAGQVEFLDTQQPEDWLASDLIGQAVENSQGESLGDVNDVLLDENGDVRAVIIGVGGFLGIGEKHVAVSFDALTFKEDTDATAGTGDSPTLANRSAGDAAGTPNPAQPNSSATGAQDQAQADAQDQAQGSGSATTQPFAQNRAAQDDDDAAAEPKTPARQAAERHDNIVLVLNTTREQLEAAPAFKYLGDQADEAENRERETNAQQSGDSTQAPKSAQ